MVDASDAAAGSFFTSLGAERIGSSALHRTCTCSAREPRLDRGGLGELLRTEHTLCMDVPDSLPCYPVSAEDLADCSAWPRDHRRRTFPWRSDLTSSKAEFRHTASQWPGPLHLPPVRQE